MNKNVEIELKSKLTEMIRLNIKPNFSALAREYCYNYKTAKTKYYE